MQVVATSLVAEHISPLIELFAAAQDGLEIAVESVPGAAFADRLEHRHADIALGPHPGAERGHDDRLGAVLALPADHRRRAGAPARRAAGARPPPSRGSAG